MRGVATGVIAAIAVAGGVAGGAVWTRASQPAPAPTVPVFAGEYSPSLARGTAAEPIDDVATCASCHERQAAEWWASAHAFASFNNPIYRSSVDAIRAEVGVVASKHCGGCHDPALLFGGAMERTIRPADHRAAVGVTCRLCHGTSNVTVDGNGSYQLRADPIPLPQPGDRRSVEVHREAVRPPDTLCAGCHRSFLGPDTGNERFLAGLGEVDAWQRSAYGGGIGQWLEPHPVSQRHCRDCHMPSKSHRFPGAHTWLAGMRGDAEQLAAVRRLLIGAASVDLAYARSGDAQWLAPVQLPAAGGELWDFEVVIANRNVGHRFPGGVTDAAEKWLEVTILDERGRVLAASGLEPDDEAHILRAPLVDKRGQPIGDRRVHQARGRPWDSTIGPREVALVRYRWQARPSDSAPALVRVRLLHRTRSATVAEVACRAHRSKRGRQFTRAVGERATDPCLPRPTTEIDRFQLAFTSASRRVDVLSWQRLYDLGRARLGDVQEWVGRAATPLRAAVAASPDARSRAAVELALGRLAIREGRTGAALMHLNRAESLSGGPDRVVARAIDQAVIERWRGRALTAVWQWEGSLQPLSFAAGATGDPGASAELAIALLSAGRGRQARAVVAEALTFAPRDSDLLRAQALSWGQEAPEALRAYIDSLPRDDAHVFGAACAADLPSCARERLPVHVHWIR